MSGQDIIDTLKKMEAKNEKRHKEILDAFNRIEDKLDGVGNLIKDNK